MAESRIKTVMDRGLASLQMSEAQKQTILANVRQGKAVRKKWSVGLVLAMVLLALAITALAVSALGGFAFLDGHAYGQPLSCAVWEDTLYVLTLDGLNAWQADASEPEQLLRWRELPAVAAPSCVRLAAGEELLLMDAQQGKVWAYRQGRMTPLDAVNETSQEIPWQQLDDVVCQDGWLFLQMDPSEDESREGLLYRVDLASGAIDRLPSEQLYRIAAYRDGKLLGVQQEKDADVALVSIDVHTGEAQPVVQMPMGSLKGATYSWKHDAIFAMVNGMFSRWDGAQWQPVCAHALPQLSFFYGVLGERYVTASHEGIQFLPIGETQQMRVLTIRGVMDAGDNDHAFQLAHPGISVQRQREMHFCQEEAAQAIRQGDTTDLFCLTLSSDDVAVLREAVQPLYAQTFRADAAAMTPLVRNLLLTEDALYGVPAWLSVNGWEVRTDWAQAVPQTLAELIKLHAAWTAQGMCAANSYEDQSWSRDDFAAYLLMQGLREHRAGDLRFTDAAFVDTLRLLQKMNFMQQTGEAGTAAFTHTTLQLYGARAEDAESQRQMMLSPVISPDAQPAAAGTLMVYVLNPNSANQETALRYLEWIASHRPPEEEARLKPDAAQPALHPGVEEWLIAPIVQEHLQWEQENGLAHDEAALQARLESLLAMPDTWAVTQEKLDAYRQKIVPYLCLDASQPASRHGMREQEMLALIQSCLAGQLRPEECARQLEMKME